jgi:hypothetical protein
VAAGAGSDPYWVEGTVYLTGPYKGAPFGLLIVTPAKAGPFNLGNVVTRAALRVNEFTAAATVESDPLPQILDGVPLRVKTVVVTLDRPGFMIAPTNCSQLAVTGSITGASPSGSPAATVAVSTPYAVTGCKALAFSPSFTASTAGNNKRGQGASLKLRIGYPAGTQANLHKVDVEVPRVLPTQDTTLKEACTERQFNLNPAGCPAHSDVASVVVHTPVLASPLTGPAYLVSHGDAAFPDVELVLQGEGVELIVDGKTQIKKNVTYSHFETIPDAPISSFEFSAPKGPHALFGAFGNFCQKQLRMPVTMTGQNGAVINQNTRVQVEDCPKSLALISKKVGKQALTISVYAPAAGKVTASAAGLSTGTKTYTGNEALSFTLKRKHTGALTTKLHLKFTPTNGKRQAKAVSEHLGG